MFFKLGIALALITNVFATKFKMEELMLRAAIAFFVLALIAYFLGANGIGGLSMDIGRMLLFVFLILAVVSFVASLISGRRGGGNIIP